MRLRFLLVTLVVAGGAIPALCADLGSSAKAAIPEAVQQIINVDYRKVEASSTALQLKQRVLPQNIKDFEAALRGVGVNPDTDVDELTFASFRVNNGLRMVGIAEGQFSAKMLAARMAKRKIRGQKIQDLTIYPAAGGMQMTLLDPSTLLFGDQAAVQEAVKARNGEEQSLNSNGRMLDLISDASSAPVWSVLDQGGTQNMLRSALGDAARLADFSTVKDRLLGSRYTVDFSNGVEFNLNVLTSDSITAAVLSSLMQAGMLYRRATATGIEKDAMQNVEVSSDSDTLKVHFKSDDQQFAKLLNSTMFSQVIR